MNRTIFSLILSASALTVCGQVRWLETEHNFGAFSEDLGAVDAIFQFVNEGTDPVRIIDARANCGCTIPEYSKGSVEPGDTGSVRATFLAMGRPGRFEKTVAITTSDNPGVRRNLRISGVVIGSTSTLSSRYPQQAGVLLLSSLTVPFGEVKRGELKNIFVEGYNQSGDTIRPVVSGLPDYVSVKTSPAAVPPGENVQFVFSLQSLEGPQWGITSEKFNISPNPEGEQTQMDFFTIVTEDFSLLTPGQRLNAPVARVSPERINLMEIGPEQRQTLQFEISNSGKLPLLIRRVQAVDSALTDVRLSSTKIKPGKKAKLTVTVNPSKATSDFINARVSLITNDPENSLIVLRITAEIQR